MSDATSLAPLPLEEAGRGREADTGRVRADLQWGVDRIHAILTRYRSGEAAALAELHEALRPAILGVLRRYRSGDLPPAISGQDLSQQTWVILDELARRWHPQGSFLAYFVSSFPHDLDHYVRRARSNRSTRRVQVIGLPHDELVVQADRVREARPSYGGLGEWAPELERLPANERAALLLRAIDGQDYTHIGRALNVSRASAHRLYRRAVQRLQQEMGVTRQ